MLTTSPDDNLSVFDHINHWSEIAPDRQAVEDNGRTYTWSQMRSRVLHLATALQALGLNAGERVAVLDKNSAACIEISAACSLIGATNALVNFRLAPAEVAWIINDSTARLVFTGPEMRPVVDELRTELPMVSGVVTIGGANDEYENFLTGGEERLPSHSVKAHDPFLQMYTSGTTGFPKGALLSNHSVMAHTRAAVPTFKLNGNSVTMVAMPMFHVSGMSFALQALSVGGKLTIVKDVVPEVIVGQLAESGITHAFFVPSVLQSFLEVSGVRDRDYSALTCLGYGGSPIALPLLRECLEVFNAGLYQVYGMTELSGALSVVGSAEHRDEKNPHRLASAGLPIPGNEVRIVDPDSGESRLTGEIGEIWVRSEQTMEGYWNKLEATAETIVDGWLRTGDAARVDEDGYIYIEDRVKDMIISGGENVYPAEVERVLQEQPGIAEVAVIGVHDERWGEVPLAVVVSESNADVDASVVNTACRNSLAGYKCPKYVYFVDALPRNASGKVLKRELREQYAAETDSRT